MNINLQLKKRRELINKEKSYQRSKVIRKYKYQMTHETDINKDLKDTNQKYEDFQAKEDQRKNYEKKLYGDDINESDNENNEYEKNDIKKIDKKIVNNEKKDGGNKFTGKKRSMEEIEEIKEKKLFKRKKKFKNLHKTNKFGQPLMKYQIANLFDKIKKKKKEGLI